MDNRKEQKIKFYKNVKNIEYLLENNRKSKEKKLKLGSLLFGNKRDQVQLTYKTYNIEAIFNFNNNKVNYFNNYFHLPIYENSNINKLLMCDFLYIFDLLNKDELKYIGNLNFRNIIINGKIINGKIINGNQNIKENIKEIKSNFIINDNYDIKNLFKVTSLN